MSVGTKTKEFLKKADDMIEYGLKETGKSLLDVGQSVVKGGIKGVANVADMAGEIGSFATDVTGITTNAGDKEGWIDKGVKGLKEKVDNIDLIDSKLDTNKVGEAIKGVAEFGGEMAAPLGVLGRLGILKKGGKFYKAIKGKLTEIPGDKVTAIVKYTQRGPAKKVLDFIRMNKKTSTAGGLVGLGMLGSLVSNPKEESIETPEENKPVIDQLTGQVATNSKGANDQSNNTINETKQELNETAGAIKIALDAEKITREEAKELLTTIKERASDHFETSISDNLGMKGMDGSFNNRAKIAEAIGIKNYQGSYDQNVAMLDKLRYMDAKEINSLLGNK